jgi:E3 SUMO-protein ligase PIAS1
VRVNAGTLQANLKGLKKKPGTAPPPDLGKLVRMTGQNRVEMVYVNSQQPVQPKKYYMTVFLVEVTTVAQLVDRLKKGKLRSSEDILAKMAKLSNDDDDIVAGPQKMSLKCPLSFMRIRTPCRSALCVHPQCFDATSWFSCMEQTTTWLCPVCEKALNADDLLIDGFFDQILKETSESVEDVIVENDGQWHTSDNKFASPTWRAAHPATTPQPSPARESSPASADEEVEAKAHVKKEVEILVLDSDDEDEGRVKRELSVSHSIASNPAPRRVPPPTAPAARQSRKDDVIDLTVDSDDESPQPQQPRPLAEKRKAPSGAPSPTEQIWKKSRLETGSPHSQQGSSATGQLSPISPGAGVPRPPVYGGSGPPQQPPPASGYAGPQLPPLRLPSTTYVPPAAGGYRSPVAATATSPRENSRSTYEHYDGNYYPTRSSGSTSRSGLWS